jgi:deoxycytidine triphosphate deaminase
MGRAGKSKQKVAPKGKERRKLEKLDRSEAAKLPHDHEWPPPIDDPRLTDYFWRDPEPDCTGVLSGDRIRAYQYATGRMIRPFQEQHLNAASYDLTLGPRCVIDGKEVILDSNRRVVDIPPSSIAFVTSREELFIPHWLVARFNLKSRYIFEGLLMGAGPQIDPGFIGVLTCPLHNISNRPIRLQLGKPFAKLDFARTTLGHDVDLSGVNTKAAFYRLGEGEDLRSRDNEVVKIRRPPKDAEPLFGQQADPSGIKSSLQSLEDEFDEVKERVRKNRIVSYSAIATLLGLLIAGTALFFDYTDGRFEDVRADNNAVVRAEVETALRNRIKQIQGMAERTDLGVSE